MVILYVTTLARFDKLKKKIECIFLYIILFISVLVTSKENKMRHLYYKRLPFFQWKLTHMELSLKIFETVF